MSRENARHETRLVSLYLGKLHFPVYNSNLERNIVLFWVVFWGGGGVDGGVIRIFFTSAEIPAT